jgi:hypothetical protein
MGPVAFRPTLASGLAFSEARIRFRFVIRKSRTRSLVGRMVNNIRMLGSSNPQRFTTTLKRVHSNQQFFAFPDSEIDRILAWVSLQD